MATTHSTTLAAAGGSLGRDECRGADSGDGGDSEHCLADHGSLLVFIGCVLASAPLDARLIRRVLRRAVLCVSNRPFCDGHHIPAAGKAETGAKATKASGRSQCPLPQAGRWLPSDWQWTS